MEPMRLAEKAGNASLKKSEQQKDHTTSRVEPAMILSQQAEQVLKKFRKAQHCVFLRQHRLE
jgi:hypothetical protein